MTTKLTPAAFERAVTAANEAHQLALGEEYARTGACHETKRRAFEACGCLVAFPRWWMRPDGGANRVDCCHLDCRIARGEFKRPAASVRVNAAIRGEWGSWLRWTRAAARGSRSRIELAAQCRAWRAAGSFNIMGAVFSAVRS